ncbi:hypothetical protein ACLNAL_29285 [Bacillus sp. AF62]|uniref:hypothetical protein n=1 Tax=Bacillus sp. AF62 TaxID=3158960 RepID=UPI00398F665D
MRHIQYSFAYSPISNPDPPIHEITNVYATTLNVNEYPHLNENSVFSSIIGVSTPLEASLNYNIGIPDENGTISGNGFRFKKGVIDNGLESFQIVKEYINGVNAVKLSTNIKITYL